MDHKIGFQDENVKSKESWEIIRFNNVKTQKGKKER